VLVAISLLFYICVKVYLIVKNLIHVLHLCVNTSLISHVVLTTRSRFLLEKLTGPQLLKKFPAFYGTLRFSTALTTARHLSLSWARSIQYMLPSHFSKIYFNIILRSTSGFSKWPPSLTFRTKPLYARRFSTIRTACPAHFNHLDFVTLMTPCFMSIISIWIYRISCHATAGLSWSCVI
jgi:hypothetical protein